MDLHLGWAGVLPFFLNKNATCKDWAFITRVTQAYSQEDCTLRPTAGAQSAQMRHNTEPLITRFPRSTDTVLGTAPTEMENV